MKESSDRLAPATIVREGTTFLTAVPEVPHSDGAGLLASRAIVHQDPAWQEPRPTTEDWCIERVPARRLGGRTTHGSRVSRRRPSSLRFVRGAIPLVSGLATLLLGGFAASIPAVDAWPQFRGPEASGVDATQPLPTRWDVEHGEGVRWRATIPGLAHASPIVAGDRVYVATAVGPDEGSLKVGLYGDIEPVNEDGPQQWRLLALDRDTGREVWNTLGYAGRPRVKRHPKSTHCNSTPATDGRRIVAIFGSEGLFCFEASGRLAWKQDLGPMKSGFFVVPSAEWGFASSPVIHQDQVIVLCDVLTNSFLAAFDLANGTERWRTARQDVPTWSTPTVVEAAGRSQIVVNGWHHPGGYDLPTGRELWRLKGGGDIPVPTPIFNQGLIYLTSAHGSLRPMRAIRPDATGDITAPEPSGTNTFIAWVHPRQGNYMQTPIAVGHWLYGCNDAGVLTCFDARTGAVQYSERVGSGSQGFTASPVSDNRHLYFTSETGNVVVVPVGAQFSTVATNRLGETCLATPAIANGTLFFRTRSKLVAVR